MSAWRWTSQEHRKCIATTRLSWRRLRLAGGAAGSGTTGSSGATMAISTPAGTLWRRNASTVFWLEPMISIRRRWLRISSRSAVRGSSTWEGKGKGPEMRAPVPTTLAMMSAAVWSAMR